MPWAVASPAPAAAHEAIHGRLVVPGDSIAPGAAFTILGSDLHENSNLVLRLVSGSTTVELGRDIVAPDGTLSTTADVPFFFPDGYAELTATDDAGSVWSTFILIGDRPEGPDANAAGRQAIDERSVWLAVLAVGLAVFAIALVRYRRAGPEQGSRG